MQQQIQVSVICNVYNHGAYVRDALEGFVMQQTNFPFEVLVHDDASTDNSADIIREYEEKYPDIIKPIYQTENQYSKGVRITVEYQLPRAQGKYIAPCEGDDYWTDPLKLQKQFDFMEAHPQYMLCACSAKWVDMRTGQVKNMCRTDADRDVTLDEIILEEKGRVFQYASIFLPTQLYRTRPNWRVRFHVGDLPLAMHAAISGKVHMLADEMVVYRNHVPDSYTDKLTKSAQYKTQMYGRVIDSLERFNEETDFQYDAVVQRRITRMRYSIELGNRNWQVLIDKKYRKVFAAKGLKAKVSDVLYLISPKLQNKVLHMTRK